MVRLRRFLGGELYAQRNLLFGVPVRVVVEHFRAKRPQTYDSENRGDL
jgi:hypothetical protein